MRLGRSRWCRKPSVIFFLLPFPFIRHWTVLCQAVAVWAEYGLPTSAIEDDLYPVYRTIPFPAQTDMIPDDACFFLPGKQRRCASESVPVKPIVFITVITSAKKIGVPPRKPGLQSCKGPLKSQTGAKVTTKRPYLGVNSELCAEKSAI